MDFTNFTNINARITAWGGIKQTAFNKKKYAAAEASWNLLSPQEIAMLDQQIPYGVEARNCDSRYHVDLWKCS